MGRIPAIEEVDPDAAVDNDHPAPRPLRLRARLPRQRYLPKALSTSCCRRSLIIKRRACSTVCFLVACPDAFWASAISLSSISIFVRIGGTRCAMCIIECYNTHCGTAIADIAAGPCATTRCRSEPSADCVPALPPENEPAPRSSHDIELLCNCDRFGRLGQSQTRKDALPQRGCETRGLRGVGRSEEGLPVRDRGLGQFAVPCLVQQILSEHVSAVLEKGTTETRRIDPIVQATVRIFGHAVAFHEAHHIVAMEFFQRSGHVLGRSCVSRFYYPRVRSAVEADPWSADALIAWNADFLEARDVHFRGLLTRERALQYSTPFGLMTGLGATLHN